MGLFKKTPDPISERSQHLNAKISDLESRIKKLNEELESDPGPSVRSTTYPNPPTAPAVNKSPFASEPVFEKVDQAKLKKPPEPPAAAPPVSEIGVRKYDFWSFVRRIKKHFEVAPAANPKLVNYLAAGSIQGLRPLRYEKRVWRNRCLALAALLLAVCLGIFYALEHRR